MPQLSLLKSPAAVQAAMDEFSQLGRVAFLKRYGFGKSRDYLVRNPRTGELCDSKAIVGVAFGKQFPNQGVLGAEDFSGGEATVVPLLQSLGFELRRIGEDWSEDEVQSTVADYFEMLRLEADGLAYNKSEHNEMLRKQLNGRSKASVELKHQNISAVLAGLGLPFIQGYKPRGNSQLLLRKAVQEYVIQHSVAVGKIVDALEEVKTPAEKSYSAALVDSPAKEERQKLVVPASVRQRLPRKLDYAARDEANRKLGRSGEHWVIGYEQHRLTEMGHPELFQQLDWVSETRGDGAGYDILSFENEVLNRYIEVKATNGGIATSFIVSHNELEFSSEAGDQFYLYRVFQLSSDPRLFILRGDLSNQLYLTPLDFRASFREHFR
ncbi:protein NO VEIN domain-containing protein [Metapseudomonas furukawaii]